MLRRAFEFAGIDRAVFFSLINKAAVICFALVTLVLVVTHFPPDRQGYYYTFTSLLVLQSFFELGVGTVLVQFISHEWIRLRISDESTLEGDQAALDRVGALVRVGLKWYCYAAVIFFAVVGIIGTLLLTRHGSAVAVVAPWWLLCAGVSVSLLQIPLKSYLEGANQISRVQRIATGVSACSSAGGWLAILAGYELYALSITAGVSAVVGLTLFGRACLPFLRLARVTRGPSTFSWKQEFWPQQWRISVSWLSGYFMFYSFVPIMFYFQGPVVAGRFGASFQIYNAVNAIASSWTYARGPRMGMLGAEGRISELKALVRGTMLRSALAAAACAALVLVVFLGMKHVNYKTDRFIGVDSMLVLLIALIILQRSNVETLAVRFQKIEPFMAVSMTSALLVVGSNIALGKYASASAVCISYATIVSLVTTPWVHKVYKAHFGTAVTVRASMAN